MTVAGQPVSAALYVRVLGPAFAQLPPRVQALHRLDGAMTWTGTADVRRGSNPLARLAASLFRLPPEGLALPLSVTFTQQPDGGEIWDRRFAGRRFLSVQSDAGNGIIAEQVGLIRLLLRPRVRDGALTLDMAGARLVRLPLPLSFCPRIATRESEVDSRYCFDVEAHLPLLGLLVHYRGSLAPQD